MYVAGWKIGVYLRSEYLLRNRRQISHLIDVLIEKLAWI